MPEIFLSALPTPRELHVKGIGIQLSIDFRPALSNMMVMHVNVLALGQAKGVNITVQYEPRLQVILLFRTKLNEIACTLEHPTSHSCFLGSYFNTSVLEQADWQLKQQ